MLKLAYTYNSQLRCEYEKIIFDDRFKFYLGSNYVDYDFSVVASSWTALDFVSVDNNDNVIGYLGATIDRGSEKIDGLKIMNFKEKGNMTFSKDLYQFIIDLFLKFNFRKIEFTMIVGNPIEKMYDKYCSKYGGRIVGIRKQNVRLLDGKYYDKKYYEIFREDFIKNYKKER